MDVPLDIMNYDLTVESELDYAIGKLDGGSKFDRTAENPFREEFLSRVSIRYKDINKPVFVGFDIAQDAADP